VTATITQKEHKNMNMKRADTIKAVIFDMDGTLFDTEKISTGGWRAAGKALGNPMSEALIDSFRGNNDEGITEKMRTHFTTEAEIEKAWEVRNQYAWDQIDRYGVPPKAGLYACLRELKEMNIVICLATGSGRERATRLCHLAGIENDLAYCLYGDEVEHGKPAPDMYLLSAAKAGFAPAQCLVVEDSFAGVRSAHAAGCPVVMIPDLDPPDDEIRSLCDAVLERLDEIPGFIASRK